MKLIFALPFAAFAAFAPIGALAETKILAIDFSPGTAERTVIETIMSAKKSVHVAAYSFTSKNVAEALVKVHRRGVEVFVVLDKSQETEKYTVATFLKNYEIPYRINSRYAIMHNKFIVVDARIVETGSFNFTSAAAKRNAENVLVIQDDEAASTYLKEWNRLWDESQAH